jgi:predicted phage terminase large subunit-like protein
VIVPQIVDDDELAIDEIFPPPLTTLDRSGRPEDAEREPVDGEAGNDADEQRHPLHHADGSPIGLQRYCESVTPVYRWDWPHMRMICATLDKVQSGEITRLIIELPPRHAKTALASIRFPAYLLELNPATRIIAAAHGDDLANDISRQTRRLVSGRVALARDRNAVAEWETEAGGAYRAKGAGAGTAGLPADYFLVDDPFGNALAAYSQATRNRLWNWFVEDVYTRLESGGRLVVTMTRRHEDDIVGRIKASEEAGDWTVLRLPAIAEDEDPLGRPVGRALWPEKFDETYLKKVEQRSPITFASLYQQRPAPAKGFIFQADWFRYYTTREHPIIENGLAMPMLPEKFTAQAISIDCSFKDKATSDFVAGLVGGRRGSDCYVLTDHIHDRLNFPATIKATRGLSARNPDATHKLVEDKANGPAVIATLRSEIAGLIGVEPEGDKVARAHAITHLFEAGNVWFPHPSIAPWVKTLTLELLQFPLGAHDDLTDALTQLLRRFDKQIQAEEAERERVRRSSGRSVRTYGA